MRRFREIAGSPDTRNIKRKSADVGRQDLIRWNYSQDPVITH